MAAAILVNGSRMTRKSGEHHPPSVIRMHPSGYTLYANCRNNQRVSAREFEVVVGGAIL